MTLVGNHIDYIRQGGFNLDGDDICARHHHVVDRAVAQFEDVGQQQSLIFIDGLIGFFALFYQFLKCIANGTVAISSAAQNAQPVAKYSARLLWRRRVFVGYRDRHKITHGTAASSAIT